MTPFSLLWMFITAADHRGVTVTTNIDDHDSSETPAGEQ